MKSSKKIITSISAPNHLKLGEYCEQYGGLYAAYMRGFNQPDYAIILPTDERAINKKIAFGVPGQRAEGADDDVDGLANTIALIRSDIIHPAARWAGDLVIGDFNDLYLPARHELTACMINVPERFEKGEWYWSSTQLRDSSVYAWFQYGGGTTGVYGKDYRGRAVAVRRLVIL